MKLMIFIIVVGTIAAINNLIGIINNGPAALQKITPIVAPLSQKLPSLGSAVLQLRSFINQRASNSLAVAALLVVLILLWLMFNLFPPSSHRFPELARLNQPTVIENRIPDEIMVCGS
jgi:hypothetical protein